MIPTLVVLMAVATPDTPGRPAVDPLSRLARNPAAERRLLRRAEANPGSFNPGFASDSGWQRTPTFGGEAFEPNTQHLHPGIAPAATGNRLRLSYSWRLEHMMRGDNPLNRIGWNSMPLGPG